MGLGDSTAALPAEVAGAVALAAARAGVTGVCCVCWIPGSIYRFGVVAVTGVGCDCWNINGLGTWKPFDAASAGAPPPAAAPRPAQLLPNAGRVGTAGGSSAASEISACAASRKSSTRVRRQRTASLASRRGRASGRVHCSSNFCCKLSALPCSSVEVDVLLGRYRVTDGKNSVLSDLINRK